MEDEPPRSVEKVDRALDAGAFVASAVPVIGGPLSNIISGIAQGRRFERVKAFLLDLGARLEALRDEVDATYVATEDFEELLEETLRRVSQERVETKHILYRDFLLGQLKGPPAPYDAQMECLRLLDVVQIDHLRVLQALLMPPGPPASWSGSPGQTLRRRLPEMDKSTLSSCVEDLRRLDLANVSLNIMMTPQGAENLAHSLTPLGKRFMHFLADADV